MSNKILFCSVLFCIRVMALYLHKSFVSSQYLENELIEFHQIIYMHSYWLDLTCTCYMSFFAHLYKSDGPLFTPKFCCRSISREQIDRNSPNFIYAFILTRSRWELIVIFCLFVIMQWPWIDVRILFCSMSLDFTA